MYLRSSIRIVSIVNSLFHCARHGSFVASTLTMLVKAFLYTTKNTYLAILWVDARQVDLRCELDLGRRIGVVWAAMDRDAVDAVLVNTLY